MGNKVPLGAFNETLQTPKLEEQLQNMQSDVLTWEKQGSVWNQLFKIKTPLFLLGQEGKTRILRGYCGVQKFNKIALPRVMSMAEETIPSNNEARVASCGHIIRGSHTVKEEL